MADELRQIGKNWTDRQMYDFLLGNDPFPGCYDKHIGVFVADGEVEAYDTADRLFEEIREKIFEYNQMDDPYAPMKPFQGRDRLAPGEVYWLYDVYEGMGMWVVKLQPVSPCRIFRLGNCGVDEYFRGGGLVGIGDGWCILLDENEEVFEND